MRIWQKFLSVGIMVMMVSLVVGMSDVASATGTPTIITVDTTGNVGKYTSLALASGGKPVISYYDGSFNYDLKLAVCNDAACSSPTISTLDSTGSVGTYTSLALASGGKPVISYYDVTNKDLKLAVCNDAACSSPTISTLDSTGDVGEYTSLALASGDVPVISYYDNTNDDLKLAVCNDAACSSPTISTLDNNISGKHTSLALASGDVPVISYFNIYSGLKLAVCNDAACSSPTISMVDNISGRYTSLALASGDVPVISYHVSDPTFDLKLAVCNDAACSSPTISTLDSTGDVGLYTSLALASGDAPVISYYDRTNSDLKLAVCNDAACSSPTISTLDSTGDVGSFTSLALASGDKPVVSYHALPNDDLKLAAYPVPPAPRPAKPPTVVVTPTVPTVAPTVVPVLPYAATAPYDVDGNLRTDTVPAGYSTFDALDITTQPLLTDTISISLTTQFLTDTPQWSLANAQPATILGKRAIRDANNTVKPMYADFKPVAYVETGYTLASYLLDFWQRAGSMTTLGLPISDRYVMDDPTTGTQMVVQYTERGRLEQPILKDGSYGLPRLGRLGAEYLAQQDPFPVAALPVAPPSDLAITYFGETRHTLQGKFADYFTTNGGLAQNGYPLTEPFIETYPEYPYPVTVQYFERVRMEYHGDPADPLYGQMTLGRIGAAVYEENQP